MGAHLQSDLEGAHAGSAPAASLHTAAPFCAELLANIIYRVYMNIYNLRMYTYL